MEFTDAVSEAVTYAKQQAEEETGGDPATMVSASVDGRSAFVQNFKEHGQKIGTAWELENVQLTDDYNLVLNVLSGTDIQSHKKKIRAYRAFEEKMEELGYSCPVDVDTYAR